MQTLPFSKNYDKLYALNDGHSATTIRRRNKYQMGEQVEVLTNGKFLCYAQIKSSKKLQILEIETVDLIRDVSPHATNREEAIKFISSFYKIPLTEESEVYLYTLKRIPENEVIK